MNNSIPPEELEFIKYFYITGHISSYHYKSMNSYKKFKKIIKNDSDAAFKVNARNHYRILNGKNVSQELSELLDDIVEHPEKLNLDCEFVKTLKLLKLYPNNEFYKWNQHIEIFNELERSNFSEVKIKEMYLFLKKHFSIGGFDGLITLDLLKSHEFNMSLILLHLDAIIFNEYFQKFSIYTYLLTGKVKGERKSIDYLFWNLVKIIACTESNKKNNTSFDLSKSIPKDENSFTLMGEVEAERLIYAVRQVKEGKRSFIFLSHLYLVSGAKKLHENLKCFNGFSLTGLWFIYTYSKFVFINMNNINMNQLFDILHHSYRSEGTNKWPSDLLNHK